MCANVGNAVRMTHDQTRGQVYFPASQGVAGQLGYSPNFSAILAIFERLYFRFIFVYAVAGEEERAPIPRNPTPLLRFLMFLTISGNLLLARSKPRNYNWIGFWHSFGTARVSPELQTVKVNPVLRQNNGNTVSLAAP